MEDNALVFDQSILADMASRVKDNKVLVGHEAELLVLKAFTPLFPGLKRCGSKHEMDLYSPNMGLRIEVKFKHWDSNHDHKFDYDMQRFPNDIIMFINLNPCREIHNYVIGRLFYVNGRDLTFKELKSIQYNIELIRKMGKTDSDTLTSIHEGQSKIISAIHEDSEKIMTMLRCLCEGSSTHLDRQSSTYQVDDPNDIAPIKEDSPEPTTNVSETCSDHVEETTVVQSESSTIDEIDMILQSHHIDTSIPKYHLLADGLRTYYDQIKSSYVLRSEFRRFINQRASSYGVDKLTEKDDIIPFMCSIGVPISKHVGIPSIWSLSSVTSLMKIFHPVIDPVSIEPGHEHDDSIRFIDTPDGCRNRGTNDIVNHELMLEIYQAYNDTYHKIPTAKHSYIYQDAPPVNMGEQMTYLRLRNPTMYLAIMRNVYHFVPVNKGDYDAEITSLINGINDAVQQRVNFYDYQIPMASSSSGATIGRVLEVFKYPSTLRNMHNEERLEAYRRRMSEISEALMTNIGSILEGKLHARSTGSTNKDGSSKIVFCFDQAKGFVF